MTVPAAPVEVGATPRSLVPPESVERALASLTKIDQSGDTRSMNRMARRLGKEQPALLRYAAGLKQKHGDAVGEAAIFYGTLIWAIFDRHVERAPRLTEANLKDAQAIADEELGRVEGLADRPVHERVATPLVARQPHVYAKLQELLAEDVRTAAITEETAALVFPLAQVFVEAFDAAIDGRRPGERVGPIVREAKVGRNDPCPCGSGVKYKKCCGQ